MPPRGQKMHYYVFNGDADGICALQQLRLASPKKAILLTGAKRETALLEKISHLSGADVTVLDIGLDSNSSSLTALLSSGCHITWFDHHEYRKLPDHALLTLHIDTACDVNTSLLVSRQLGHPFPLWAIVGLFGDNLESAAYEMAETYALALEDIEQLWQLGRMMNYNAYGRSLSDLHWHPAQLAEDLLPYASPLDFIRQTDFLAGMTEAYREDMEKALAHQPAFANVYVLPGEPWARRMMGEFGNALSRHQPAEAFAVLVGDEANGYQASVRSPKGTDISAAALCRRYPVGGGRVGAAGINHLPAVLLYDFVACFHQHYGCLV